MFCLFYVCERFLFDWLSANRHVHQSLRSLFAAHFSHLIKGAATTLIEYSLHCIHPHPDDALSLPNAVASMSVWSNLCVGDVFLATDLQLDAFSRHSSYSSHFTAGCLSQQNSWLIECTIVVADAIVAISDTTTINRFK